MVYECPTVGPCRRRNRVNVALKLRRLAERTHTNPGTLARPLLSTALDEADPDRRTATDLLDRIDGPWENAVAGLAESETGEGIPLEDLRPR